MIAKEDFVYTPCNPRDNEEQNKYFVNNEKMTLGNASASDALCGEAS